MTWIRVIKEEEADEALRKAYQRVKGSRGKVSNILAVHSLHPSAMAAHLDLYTAIMFGPSGLSREEREAIAIAVSATNRCPYCVAHHAEALQHYWKDRPRVEEFVAHPRSASLPPRLRALVDYALKLTERPSEMERGDVEALRRHDLSDGDILTVNLIASYFNFVNRIALGLGVELSASEVSGYVY